MATAATRADARTIAEEAVRDAIRTTKDGERAHVDEMACIADNLESLTRQASRPILGSALAILRGLASEEWEPTGDEPPALWHDLRPSEALELRDLVDEAILRAERQCEDAIVGELASAAGTFAERHPDLPVSSPYMVGEHANRLAER